MTVCSVSEGWAHVDLRQILTLLEHLLDLLLILTYPAFVILDFLQSDENSSEGALLIQASQSLLSGQNAQCSLRFTY
jgi:hypothetical protein